MFPVGNSRDTCNKMGQPGCPCVEFISKREPLAVMSLFFFIFFIFLSKPMFTFFPVFHFKRKYGNDPHAGKDRHSFFF